MKKQDFNRLQHYDSRKRVLWLASGKKYVSSDKNTTPAPRPFRTRLDPKLKVRQKAVEVLSPLESMLGDYIYFSDPRFKLLLALWIVGTYIYSAFSYFGYLYVFSKFMRCGKTTILELISRLAYEASAVLNAPTAASIRDTAAEGGTVILDTLERLEAKSSEAHSAIMELLDAGFRQGGTVCKMVPVKEQQYVRQLFAVYAPYALAAISKDSLSETAQDRAFLVEMCRKPLRVKKARLDFFECEERSKPVRNAMYQWALKEAAHIAEVYRTPELQSRMDQFRLNDRAVDIWKPLFAILEVLGFSAESSEWQELATLAQTMHHNPEIAEAKQQLRVLAGLRSISSNGRISGMTTDLLRALKEKHIDLREREFTELLREWGFEQKSMRLNGQPRRGWDISVEQLNAVKKKIGENVVCRSRVVVVVTS